MHKLQDKIAGCKMLMKLTPIWGLTRQISPLNLCGSLKKIDIEFCERHPIELFTVERILN
jgi:hypothetical protein